MHYKTRAQQMRHKYEMDFFQLFCTFANFIVIKKAVHLALHS